MADAHGSGPCVRKDVRVQLPPRPLVVKVPAPTRRDLFRVVVTRQYPRAAPGPPTVRDVAVAGGFRRVGLGWVLAGTKWGRRGKGRARLDASSCSTFPHVCAGCCVCAGGISSGMFSYPMAEDVLRDLGDKVVGALVDATSAARADLSDYRHAFPSWVADSSDRGLSNWIHDRLWAHLRRGLTDIDSVALVDQGVTREVTVGLRYRARVKRHTGRDRIRSYATGTAVAFWAQSDALEGLEEVRPGFGYRWDPDERVIGSTIVSLRDGLDKMRSGLSR